MNFDSALSRPIATARNLAGSASDFHRLPDKRVLLTGQREILRTNNGRECLLAALRLLPRICPNVTIALPPGFDSLAAQCRQTAEVIAFGPPIEIKSGQSQKGNYDAVLSVAAGYQSHLPLTIINSNGWLARVSSRGENLPGDCAKTNPIGAFAAASLGVSEVFKRLITLKEKRGPLFGLTEFSLSTYSTDDHATGPDLSSNYALDAILCGLGAIGNGVTYLLSRLSISGRLDLVDPQAFGPENLGTCILIGPHDVERALKKTELAKAFLAGRLKVESFVETLDKYRSRLGSLRPYPRIVLTALDNIPARHQAQQIWPDVVIDGAIGQLECQVSVHPWPEDVACLQCQFREEPVSSEKVAALATGLTASRIRQADAIVTGDDVENAPPEKREWLKKQLGRPICSVIQEELARQISEAELPENFRPSVPFVATMSAAMVVGELIRYLDGGQQVVQPQFQFDLLFGPQLGQKFDQSRRKDCTCTTRASNIERVRERRFADLNTSKS